jgi:hypothetical protein
MLKLLEIGGNPAKTKYLFLGDFVDRGSFSIEVLILLYSIKVSFFDFLSSFLKNKKYFIKKAKLSGYSLFFKRKP